MSTDEHAYITSTQYDDATRTLLASSFNNTRLFQIKTDYESTGYGVRLVQPPFGTIVGHYLCGVTASETCGDIARIQEGAITLTGQPTGVTFYSNERLGR